MDELFSLRIFKIEYYLTRPTIGLDPVYSDFHGYEVEKIPVLRIFGSNTNGEKTCLHIHGILPYFYIPYDRENLGSIEKITFEVAASINKALNISFGQANSTSKHVFKVQLVKAIPFYGYHQDEHLFLKIFLYNPRHVKCVSNLLQNGAILDKKFQPYEAHIPFILQFLKDFNLSGMGLLHVPKNFIKYRKPINQMKNINMNNDDDNDENETNNLPRRMSKVSKIEGDINAELILNRYLESNEKNSGIESLWMDELSRRKNLGLEDFKSPNSPTRNPILPSMCAEQEYYISVLKKLIDIKNEQFQSCDQRKRNLLQSSSNPRELSNCVYPEKYSSQHKFDNIMDASLVPNHISFENSSSLTLNNTTNEIEIILTPPTTVNQMKNYHNHIENEVFENDLSIIADDEFIMTVSQNNKITLNQTLIPEDYEVLDVLKELEENVNSNVIDLDSTLAAVEPKSPNANAAIDNESYDKAIDYTIVEQPITMSDIIIDDEIHSIHSSSSSCDRPLNLRFNDFSDTDEEDVITESLLNSRHQLSSSDDNVIPQLELKHLKRSEAAKNTNLNLEKNPTSSSSSSYLSNHVAKEYDRKNNFYPKPGPSHLKNYELIEVPNPPKNISEKFNDASSATLKESQTNKKSNKDNKKEDNDDDDDDYDKNSRVDDNFVNIDYDTDEMPIQSFYEEDSSLSLSLSSSKELINKQKKRTSTIYSTTNNPHCDNKSKKIKISSTNLLTDKITKNKKLCVKIRKLNMKKINNNKNIFAKANQTINDDVMVSSTETAVTNDKSNHSSNSRPTSSSSKSAYEQSFGLTGPTLDNTFGFKYNLDKLKNIKSDIEPTFLTVLSLEIFAPKLNDLKPDPKHDMIICAFYSIMTDDKENNSESKIFNGYIIVNDVGLYSSDFQNNDCLYKGSDNDRITVVENEFKLIDEIINLLNEWDPDILVGYEIEMSSWGYLIERGKHLKMNLISKFSRVDDITFDPDKTLSGGYNEEFDFDSEINLNGRILLNIWRIIRSEISLTSYTFENVMYHILHKRNPLPKHSYASKNFYNDKKHWTVISYYMERVKSNLELLNQLDIIDRTSEMAKIFGIQLYEVLSRGSQYRVESMMLRTAKQKNFIPISPSIQQRANMRAPLYVPLILEPQSNFYTDSVIVLDFQSLYPSLMIAYNYCFSTCLGSIENLSSCEQPFEFGTSNLRVSNSTLLRLVENDLINVSPCGVAFVKSEVREGVLPKMLKEILETRLMIKQSMKLYENNEALKKKLHSRQLALKLMANVTYGYTAANFSGRMPCVELGDSIVSMGRQTLQRAIELVNSNKEWNAKVIYGDTDSLFVLVSGKKRRTAFRIGQSIAETVTEANPKPVKLKFEKIYSPCILQTKKRYVGYMFESSEQTRPVFEAKGIETVRRDGCPATAKILQESIQILFETRSVNEVKKYVCRQFEKILSDKVNTMDFIFAKEFRGISGYKPGACVPALELAKKWIKKDPRSEPRKGERVPYVIVNGPPNEPLIKLVRSPNDLLTDEGLSINTLYYIKKSIIPALNRCFLLTGNDINEWFEQLQSKSNFPALLQAPATSSSSTVNDNNDKSKKTTILQYFSSKNCAIGCENCTNNVICEECRIKPSQSVTILQNKISDADRHYHEINKICELCCGRYLDDSNYCRSFDCPVLFLLHKKQKNYKQIKFYKNILDMF